VNTIRANTPSVSQDAQTARPDQPPTIDQPKEQTAPESSANDLALLQLRDTIAKLDVLRFRSMFDLFKSIPSAIQSPSRKQAAKAYSNQMVLQK
jgi:hypothetical protein